MTLANVLKTQREAFRQNPNHAKALKEHTDIVVEALKHEIAKKKNNTQVFTGGSYAKNTLLPKKENDIDLFVRFDPKIKNPSEQLKPLVAQVAKRLKLKAGAIHGSRDYYTLKAGNTTYEIIPVTKITKPQNARNVTDLSYFHVGYVKKQLKNTKLNEEILLAKKFFTAQEVYGAESYISGFSGYATECLIIKYKSFTKLLKALLEIKDKLILDPVKHYKNKNEILLNINESKLQSPIIFVDPTWKERNVTAALTQETLQTLQEHIKIFLKNPRNEDFEPKPFDIESLTQEAKKKKYELLRIRMKTNRQAGDIAGTKMKKFSRYLEGELSKYYTLQESTFRYGKGQESAHYITLKSKKSITLQGPPTSMKKHAERFKKENKNAKVRKGHLYAKKNITESASNHLHHHLKNSHGRPREMGITAIKIERLN